MVRFVSSGVVVTCHNACDLHPWLDYLEMGRLAQAGSEAAGRIEPAHGS